MPRQNNPLLIPSLFERTHNLRIFIEELKDKGENIYVSKVDSKVYFKKNFQECVALYGMYYAFRSDPDVLSLLGKFWMFDAAKNSPNMFKGKLRYMNVETTINAIAQYGGHF